MRKPGSARLRRKRSVDAVVAGLAALLTWTGAASPEELRSYTIAGDAIQGTLAPDLSEAGSRWSEGQLRLRLVDATRLNPDTIMPAYYRVEGLTRVGPTWLGKPILNAGQIEDVIAFLVTLRD